MNFREATVKDIKDLHVVRMSVKENKLRNPAIVTEGDYINFLTTRGKGWLCEINGTVAGFAIVDSSRNTIWALFVKPEFEKKGIGRKLHTMMLNWLFSQTEKSARLGTAPNTRAEKFYALSGWKEIGVMDNGDIKLEMTYATWKSKAGSTIVLSS